MSAPVALVTGASSGIGRASALALTAAGFQVVGTSRRASSVKDPGPVVYVDLDVTSDDSVATAVDDVLVRFGRIDVLVNNAGVGLAGAAEESSVGQVRELFETNLFGVVRMNRAVLPHLRARGEGRIVNISSVLGLIPAPYLALYAATKHALEGYSESLDHELREHGIRSLLVEPGYTSTAFEASTQGPDVPLLAYEKQRETALTVVAEAMRRADDPSIVARVVVAAATDTDPRVRYPAGSLAKQVSILRRFAPRSAFDRQIRKLNRLPKPARSDRARHPEGRRPL